VCGCNGATLVKASNWHLRGCRLKSQPRCYYVAVFGKILTHFAWLLWRWDRMMFCVNVNQYSLQQHLSEMFIDQVKRSPSTKFWTVHDWRTDGSEVCSIHLELQRGRSVGQAVFLSEGRACHGVLPNRGSPDLRCRWQDHRRSLDAVEQLLLF